MEGIVSVFQSILDTKDDYREIYLDHIGQLDCLHSKSLTGANKIVQHISSALSKGDTCRVGLILLKCYMQHATLEVVEAKALLWCNLTVKAFNFKELDSFINLIYSALSDLALNCNRSPETSKSFASNHLPKVYESLGKISSLGLLEALRCTEICLQLYPGPSGPYRSLIEKFLIKFIDIPDESLNIWSGKCVHLLQQVRGGGVQGISHKAAWLSYQKKLLGTLHTILDLTYANCTELHDRSIESDLLEIPDLELYNEPANRIMQLYIRFRNCVNYLIIALQQPFPVAKPVLPKKILNFISRGLSVTCIVLQNNPISDNLTLELLLPQIHCYLLKLLEALIVTLKMNLKIHYQTILGFLVDTLQWTSSNKNNHFNMAFISLRSKAYELLTLWCTIMRNGSRIEVMSEALAKEILTDITPLQNEITLQVLSGLKKHMSKKARRQLHKTQNEQSNLSQLHANKNATREGAFPEGGNVETCVAALKCLRSIFISAANLLKPPLIKMVQLKIIQICGTFFTVPVHRQHLYYSWECRLEIYKLMYVFIEQTHQLCPPPTQITINVFQMAQMSDNNIRVREHCSDALFKLEKLLHPSKSGLSFPTDLRDIRNTFIKFGQEHLLKDSIDFNISSNDSISDLVSDDEENHIASELRKENEKGDELITDITFGNNSTLSEEAKPKENKETADNMHKLETMIESTCNIICKKSNTAITSTIEKNTGNSFNALTEVENDDISKESNPPEIIETHEGDSIIIQVEKEKKLKNHPDIDLLEPLQKKQRLESHTSTVNLLSSECEDDILAEIEATFVDELN